MDIIFVRNTLLWFFVVGFFFFPQLQTVIIAACFLTLLVDRSYYKQVGKVLKNKLGVAMIGYFLILTISLVYSQNLPEGLRTLETKFSFFVFPFFLPILLENSTNQKKLLPILLYSGLAYIVVSFIDAGIHYQSTQSLTSFFYTELGVGFFKEGSFVHPAYASFFYNILIAYVGLNLIKNQLSFTRKLISAFLLGLMALFIFMLSSKFGILALAVNSCLLLLFYIKESKQVTRAILVFLLGTFSGVIVITQTPLKQRFEAAFSAMTNGNGKYSSSQTRLDVWSVTTEIIGENPLFGVGIGDIRDELLNKYNEKGYLLYSERGYDSHQEFLQTWAASGVPGIGLLLILFFLMFQKARQTNNFLLTIFSILFLLFGMVESMLERQAGVVFFVFFGMLLYSFTSIKAKN